MAFSTTTNKHLCSFYTPSIPKPLTIHQSFQNILISKEKKMARGWFRTYVLAVFGPSRSSKRGLSKEEMNISAPLPDSVRHHSPVPYLPRSISAVDLPTEPEPAMYARRNSDDADSRRLTVQFREPSSRTPPPTSFPNELAPRFNPNSLESPVSPSNRLSKRMSQFGSATRDVMASQSAGNPRPVSIFAPGFDISMGDMMPIHHDEKQQRQVKRLSTMNVMRSMENDHRRESRRMSRRMTTGFDTYQKV
jgi:hypothetical protein